MSTKKTERSGAKIWTSGAPMITARARRPPDEHSFLFTDVEGSTKLLCGPRG